MDANHPNPIRVEDETATEAEAYARQLRTEIKRTGIQPVSAEVSRYSSLEVIFSDGEIVQFDTLYSGKPGHGTRTTARVLVMLGFGDGDLGKTRREVQRSGNRLLKFTRTPQQ